ncbi:hypothetical protein [Endozoicomonas ascidiicola]|uniref:hypothetical protein n=1 Tax=Endozoicomonas ascidiicola TaxID=1698521 RepID=UPI00082C80F5|nr:hypothetical protein [Endozoicomonas ascidiicola]
MLTNGIDSLNKVQLDQINKLANDKNANGKILIAKMKGRDVKFMAVKPKLSSSKSMEKINQGSSLAARKLGLIDRKITPALAQTLINAAAVKNDIFGNDESVKAGKLLLAYEDKGASDSKRNSLSESIDSGIDSEFSNQDVYDELTGSSSMESIYNSDESGDYATVYGEGAHDVMTDSFSLNPERDRYDAPAESFGSGQKIQGNNEEFDYFSVNSVEGKDPEYMNIGVNKNAENPEFSLQEDDSITEPIVNAKTPGKQARAKLNIKYKEGRSPIRMCSKTNFLRKTERLKSIF